MRVFFIIFIGLCSGVLGGLGMGGGNLLIPILINFLSIEIGVAQNINLISFIPMSIVALIFHIKHKLVKFKYVFYMVISGILFVILGVFLASIISNILLKKLFGIFLICISILSFILTMVEIRKKKKNKNKDNKVEIIDKNSQNSQD